ncbi:MAG: hypothetical protein R3F49_20225 [Planctomycetota bacterium]
MTKDHAARSRGPLALALTAAAFAAAACTSKDQPAEIPFILRATNHAVAASTPIVGDGDLMAYLADEATTGPGGTDLNTDGDTLDSVVVRVDTASGATRVLAVDADQLVSLNGTLLMVVRESTDSRDWNGDLDQLDTVLLYHVAAETLPVFLAELEPGVDPALTLAADVAFFATATAPTVEFETNLAFVRVAARGTAPSAPMAIVSTIDDLNNDGVSARFAGARGDIVFCLLDETADGNLNGDGDATDTTVLAVLDAGESVPTLYGTGLALSSSTAIAAEEVGSDWVAAFLVSEAAQSANLNDPALFAGSWQPANCSGRSDVDTLDHVLHWFEMSDLVANARVVNTGLVGASAGPVFVHPAGFVAVVSNEADEGNGGCDLNGDSDFTDPIFRWVEATDPLANVLPVTDANRLFAVATTLPGGSGGAVVAGTVFAIAVDEALDGRDHDSAPLVDRVLIAAHAPATGGQGWNFLHGSVTAAPVAVSWMADDARSSSRFYAAITEDGRGADINGDGDMLDSIPTFPTVLSTNRLGFPGVAVAVAANNAGIAAVGGYAFYRVSEAADGAQDRNGDGDASDQVLQRVKLDGSSAPSYMGSLNTISALSLDADLDGVQFGAFLYQESLFGVTGNDLNGDGDGADLVVRYFRLP